MSALPSNAMSPAASVSASSPVQFTAAAIEKVKQMLSEGSGLRLGVVGGGCSGFKYSMQFEDSPGPMDKVYELEGVSIIIDSTSLMYLRGTQVDYIDTLQGAGFKFENPNVTSTCGCGSSFRA